MKYLCVNLITTLFALLFCTQLCANTIQIESDTAYYDHHQGTMTHTGNVTVHWLDRILFADQIILYKKNDGEINYLKATGSPATFTGTLTQSSPIHGKAQIITFEVAHNLILLEQNAELTFAGDRFQGPLIRFNFNTQRLYADKSDSQRPTLTFGENLTNLNQSNKP